MVRLPRSLRLPVAAAALALAAPAAHAQFTPTVPPPRQPRPAADVAAPRAQAVRDTFPKTHLSDLRAWVDSVTAYAPGTLPAPGAFRPPATPTDTTPGAPAGPDVARPRRAADRPRKPAAPVTAPAPTPR